MAVKSTAVTRRVKTIHHADQRSTGSKGAARRRPAEPRSRASTSSVEGDDADLPAGRQLDDKAQSRPVDKAMRAIPARNGFRSMVVDLSEVGRMDTAGAWLIERLLSSRPAPRASRPASKGRPRSRRYCSARLATRHKDRQPSRGRPAEPFILFLARVGERVYEMRNDFLAAMNILGATIRGGQMKLGRGHGINLAAIFNADRPHGRRRDPGGRADVGHRRRHRRRSRAPTSSAISAPTSSSSTSSASWCCANSAC